jgi:hypothetical protein
MIGSTIGKRFGIGAGVVLASLVVAIGASAGTGQPGWQKALHARSEALNQEYGLGDHALGTLGVSGSDWRGGLRARSEALNQKYGLAGHVLGTLAARRAGWQRALGLRSDGLNRVYGLGSYASAHR